MNRLFDRISSWWPILLSAMLLGGLFHLDRLVRRQLEWQKGQLTAFRQTAAQVASLREHFTTLRDLKDSDAIKFKEGFAHLAQSNKMLFESGLSLQEERRLLDKQLEIMTTSLFINPALQRIFIMRADQILQSFLISYIPLKAFGGVPTTLANTVRIVSKERFANPDRGQSETINGQLQYVPPQVGTSVRSNALGEFVIFTNSKLILHGPPLNSEAHEAFPHICLGLDRETARRLYRSTFIGTRITLNASAVAEEPSTTVSISTPVANPAFH